LFQHFEKYIKLNDTLKGELADRVHFKTFKKGELIHDADTVCTKSFFIQKGLLRTYFLKEGKEISEYFPAEGEWCNSPKSFMTRQVDIYFIDAVENTEVFCLNVNDLVYLFDNFPEMERYARLSMGTTFGHLLERITSLRFTTAKEKYDHFIQTYHDIHHRIPLGMVASYLGITQETLSRIRAEK
jgi:CRP-like cAMP-binding protein